MFESFNEAETFLLQRENLGIKPGLQRINRLLTSLGHPEQKIKGIHIAGTNGKGSTVHFLKKALMQHDYCIGTFTSPSMFGMRGHMMLQDECISEKKFTDFLNDMLPVILRMDEDEMAPTSFEIMTVLAFYFFAKYADIAIIEAGMGGREDTTNCFIPVLSIITNVALDHVAFLGNTVEKIASHKAGIIKENIPVIIGEMSPEAMAVVQSETTKKHAELYVLNKDFVCKNVTGEQGSQFLFKHEQYETNISLQVPGAHQKKNASLAMMAILLLKKMQFNLNLQHALSAISTSVIAGRFEKIHENPLIIVDSAHNPAGISAFLQTVQDVYPNQHKKLLFAGFKDKDLEQMASNCQGYFDEILLTSFSHPRAIKASELKNMFPYEKIYFRENFRVFIDCILNDKNSQTIYFVAGSFHFIADVRNYLLRNL